MSRLIESMDAADAAERNAYIVACLRRMVVPSTVAPSSLVQMLGHAYDRSRRDSEANDRR